MKGNPKIPEVLNNLLADELTAINQYMVHAEVCDNWGYTKLHDAAQGRARQEMKHAEKLIGRIVFLEGAPIVSNLNEITIGTEVAKQLENDVKLEYDAVAAYNDAIKVAVEAGDNTTRELLESILKEEESHVDYLEAQLAQVSQMGIQNYLSEQV
jgi:bacterioferritin